MRARTVTVCDEDKRSPLWATCSSPGGVTYSPGTSGTLRPVTTPMAPSPRYVSDSPVLSVSVLLTSLTWRHPPPPHVSAARTRRPQQRLQRHVAAPSCVGSGPRAARAARQRWGLVCTLRPRARAASPRGQWWRQPPCPQRVQGPQQCGLKASPSTSTSPGHQPPLTKGEVTSLHHGLPSPALARTGGDRAAALRLCRSVRF